jgi:hypothetical protein
MSVWRMAYGKVYAAIPSRRMAYANDKLQGCMATLRMVGLGPNT